MMNFQCQVKSKGCLESIVEFISYCFAVNSHNYALRLSFHYIHKLNLTQIHPNVSQYFHEIASFSRQTDS